MIRSLPFLAIAIGSSSFLAYTVYSALHPVIVALQNVVSLIH